MKNIKLKNMLLIFAGLLILSENIYSKGNKKNPVAELFTPGKADTITLGEFSLSYKNGWTTNLDKKTGTAYINADTHEVFILYKYDVTKYWLFFDNDAREKLRLAAAKYNSDFENKKLNKNDKKSYKIYGETAGKFEYATVMEMKQCSAKPDYQFGYVFEKKSPYFTITAWASENLLYKDNKNLYKQSPQLKLYFTRNQLKQFLEAISEDSIQEEIQALYMAEEEIKADEYHEDETSDEDTYIESDSDNQ